MINYFSWNYIIGVICFTFLWRGHSGFFTIVNTMPRSRKQPYKWIIEKIFKDKQWSILANYTGLTMIYCVSCFVVSIFIKNFWYTLIGVAISTTYLICGLIWLAYYKSVDRYIEKISKGVKVWDYTKVAEIFVGGIAAIGFYFCL